MSNIINFISSTKDHYKITMALGGTHYILTLPFKIKGRGISDRIDDSKFYKEFPNLNKYLVTAKTLERLSIKYPILQEMFADELHLNTRILERRGR